MDDLLEVSRITTGKLKLRKERVELAALVQSPVETTRPLIDEQGHHLSVRLPRTPLRHIVKNHHRARNCTCSISDESSTVFDTSFPSVFADQSDMVSQPHNYSIPQNYVHRIPRRLRVS